MTDEQRPYGSGQADPALKRVRTRHFQRAKEQGIKITGLTSYDFLSASIFDDAGIDFLLVGDSAGNTVFGYDTTIPVTVDELIPLTAAVVRGAKRALVIADMPFGSYENGPDDALATAIRFMKETGAHAVKLEGGVRSAKQIKRIVRAGIPVMAHIGFTPQSEHGLGGHIIQGRGEDAEQLLADAHAVEDAGAFAVVLEMVPSGIAGAGDRGTLDPDDLGRRRPGVRRPTPRMERLGGIHPRTHPEVRQAVRIDRPDPARRRHLVPRRRRGGRVPGARARVRRVSSRLHVVTRGSGAPIVFLHGMGTSAATWNRCMELLDDRFTVVAPDLLGHGDSPVLDDPSEYTRDRTLVDVDDILADLDAPPVLVGHSLGGYLALAYAATRPARRERRGRAQHRARLSRRRETTKSGTPGRGATPTDSACRSR